MAGKQSDTLLFPRRKRHLFPSIAASPFQPFSLPSPQGKQTSPSLEWMKTVWRRGEERKESKAIRGGDSQAFFLFCRNWGEIGRSVGRSVVVGSVRSRSERRVLFPSPSANTREKRNGSGDVGREKEEKSRSNSDNCITAGDRGKGSPPAQTVRRKFCKFKIQNFFVFDRSCGRVM